MRAWRKDNLSYHAPMDTQIAAQLLEAIKPCKKTARDDLKISNVPTATLDQCLQELEQNDLIFRVEDKYDRTHTGTCWLLDHQKHQQDVKLAKQLRSLTVALLVFGVVALFWSVWVWIMPSPGNWSCK